MAGTRTNALVASGAAAFVTCGLLLDNDPSATDRIVSYVVSGVGVLGEGHLQRWRERARTQHCRDNLVFRRNRSAVWSWLSEPCPCFGGGLAYLVLRPLAYRLHPVLPDATPVDTLYEVRVTCRVSAAAHIRAYPTH
jgi:putative Mg2+ transporter-C (MgtC) family protein